MSIHIRPLDLVVIIVYLLGMAGLSVCGFRSRNKTTEEYFLSAAARFPDGLFGLSMLGTSISSVTFLAFPAAAYTLDWRQLVSNLTLPAGCRAGDHRVHSVLPSWKDSHRPLSIWATVSGRALRLYGTLSFILLQLIRLAKVLFLVAIPVSLLTGIDIRLVIVFAVGIFISRSTPLPAALDAVIWTDVVQSIVLWIGGLVCFAIHCLGTCRADSRQIIEVAAQHDKFDVGSLGLQHLNERTFWTVALTWHCSAG